MSSPADGLLIPAAERISLALGGGLGAIVAIERHRLRSLGSNVLFVRWRTWVVTAPIFGAAVMWSRWGTVVLATAIAFQGTREYVAMATMKPTSARAAIVLASAAPVAVGVAPGLWGVLPVVAVLGIALVPMLAQDGEHGARDAAAGVFGFLWIAMFASTIILLRDLAGPGLLLALGTAVAMSDVFAFVAGKVAGRRLLAPRLSPSKTVEGALGNIVGAVAGFALMNFAVADVPTGLRIALPFVIGIGCLWGDLLESMVKRTYGVKDAGTWLPGFGGLLDRVDSLLVVLPLALGTVAMFS